MLNKKKWRITLSVHKAGYMYTYMITLVDFTDVLVFFL